MSKRRATSELLNARRDLDDLPGVEILQDLAWYEYDGSGHWVLHCRLTPGLIPTQYVPSTTEWYVEISPDYPYGEIRFYPSKHRSIERTFHHQLYIHSRQDDLPWHWGDICRFSPMRTLSLRGSDPEPLDPWKRLSWHFTRALQWLQDAACDRLILPGEPFELPHYLSRVKYKFVFSEDAGSMAAMYAHGARSGYATLFTSKTIGSHVFLKCLYAQDGAEVSKPSWGKHIIGTANMHRRAVWILLAGPPVLAPWHAPGTWGELSEAIRSQGLSLRSLISSVSSHVRDGETHLALIGFPIPERYGEQASHIHWLGLQLPLLTRRAKKPQRKWRINKHLRYIDWKKLFKPERKLDWSNSENWHPEQVSRRRGIYEH
jgi:hypothetical protein